VSKNYRDRITVNPNQCGGKPCIRGMRVRVKDILEMLASGMTQVEILEQFPYLETEDIVAAPQFAATMGDSPFVSAAG